MTVTQIKSQARESLKGNWGKSALFVLFYIGLSILMSLITGLVPVFGVAAYWIFAAIVMFGITLFFLNISRAKEAKFSDIFMNIKTPVGTIVIVYFMMSLSYVLLAFATGFLFLSHVLIGILVYLSLVTILVLNFSMVYYILLDEPETKAFSSIIKSVKLMKGHKLNLFVLYLSFIGWFFLSILTLGIGFLFLIPYIYVCTAKFYDNINGKNGGNLQGTVLQKKFCTICGTKQSESSKFCSNCGKER